MAYDIKKGGLMAAGPRYRMMLKSLDHVISPNGVSSYLELVSPLLSWRQCFASVVHIRSLNPDTVIMTLKPNHLWKNTTPGQYIMVGVVINGVRLQRYYSPISIHDNLVDIAVSRHPGGVVSNFIVDNLALGDTVSLGPPDGRFVLPPDLPDSLLLVSGGSGFTPLVAMLEYLVSIHYAGRVHVVHYGPAVENIACIPLYSSLVEKLPHASFTLGLTQQKIDYPIPGVDHVVSGRIKLEHFQGFNTSTTFACGPAGLVQAVRGLIPPELFHSETFTPVLAAKHDIKSGETVQVTCSSSHKDFKADCGQSLLDAALKADVEVDYGCKMGICFRCAVLKKSGAVRNVITGQRDEDPDVSIQLCISVPESDIVVDI